MRSWPARLGAALALLALGLPAGAAENRVAVVVSSSAPMSNLSAEDLAQIYRRRKLFVAGQRVQPINLSASHPLRRFFSQAVLQKTPEELEDYWRDMYFNGVFPPFVLASEEAMLRFVAGTPGAVGYVSMCAVDRRVTVLLTLDGGPACTK